MSFQILVFHLLCSLYFLLRALIKVCVAVKTEAYLELVPKHKRSENFRESVTVYFPYYVECVKGYKAKSAKGKSNVTKSEEAKQKLPRILFHWSHTGH